jgi:hypothetical protein
VLQQAPDKVNDLISLLLEAANEIVERKDENGQFQQVVIPDSESIWMQTKMVNSPTFARYVLKLRDLYDLGMAAGDYMCAERATVIQKQVIGKYKSHKYSIDAKSSETLRDKHNSQSSLNHIILRQHQERSVTVKGEAGKSMMDGIMGREAQKEEQQY